MTTASSLINHVVLLIFAGLLIWAAVSDIRTYKIPNTISLLIAGIYPAHVLSSTAGVDWLGGLGVGAAVLGVGFIIFALRIIGGGDVKLAAATALWAGPEMIAEFLLLTALAGGLLSIVMFIRNWLIKRYQSVPVDGADTPAAAALKTVVPYGAAVTMGGLLLIVRLLGL